MRKTVGVALAVGLFDAWAALPEGRQTTPHAEARFIDLVEQGADYSTVPDSLFQELGWDLPDHGLEVQRLAERAPGGALEPEALGYLPGHVGYRAKWHTVRYTYYGLAWDISGLYLEPNSRAPGLPTLVLVADGTSNWYTFFLDPSNNPGIAQYLAQRVPVLLVSVPGSYRRGGWSDPPTKRKPAYELDRDLGGEEIRARNAVFTFRLVSEGILRLVQQATKGPLLIVGCGTAEQFPFLLEERLGVRVRGLLLGWSSRGPASLARIWTSGGNERDGSSITELRSLDAEALAKDSIGPLDPLLREPVESLRLWQARVEADPQLPLTIARRYLEAESVRQPLFEPVLHHLEALGHTVQRERMADEIRVVSSRTGYPPSPNEVIADLFATVRAPLTGYHRMIWMAGSLDPVWGADPEQSPMLLAAEAFRERSPEAAVKTVVLQTPLTSLAHLERPRQLAGAWLAATRWLSESRGDGQKDEKIFSP